MSGFYEVYFVSHFYNSMDLCSGSKILCEYAIDGNDTFLESQLKNLIWPKHDVNDIWTTFKRIRTLSKNMIIVKLKFNSPTVDLTVMDSRSTLSDKIAKLGGTFGIWVQLTGCTLLVLINVFIIAIKMGFKICN